MAAMKDQSPELELPGFRFHPTDEELLEFYLKSAVFGKKLRFGVIDFLNIYNHHPQELPGLAKIGEREWYFFVARDRKHGSGGRPNRTTENGFWKATGSDRKIVSLSEPKRQLGLRKTLVFYQGRAPKGTKTDWVMNEYRFPNNPLPKDIVLCKIYRKATSLKVLEQRVAMEEERRNSNASPSSPPYSSDTISFCSQLCEDQIIQMPTLTQDIVLKEETQQAYLQENIKSHNDQFCSNTSPKFQLGKEILPALPELQVPKLTVDWTQDPIWTHELNSPWLPNLMLCPNILNFY